MFNYPNNQDHNFLSDEHKSLTYINIKKIQEIVNKAKDNENSNHLCEHIFLCVDKRGLGHSTDYQHERAENERGDRERA